MMNDGVMLARPAPGTVGETQRVCHVFAIPEGPSPRRIAALCGESFGPGELERLDGPTGMPCERCLTRVPQSTRGVDESVAGRLDLIERALDQLQWHLDGLRVALTELANGHGDCDV